MQSPDSTVRNDARKIFDDAVKRVGPENCVTSTVFLRSNRLEIQGSTFQLNQYDGIYVFAFGKAAIGMFDAMASILADRLTHGMVITNTHPGAAGDKCGAADQWFKGTHPLPSKRNIEATEELINQCGQVTEDDLVIFLISGGGSSLLFAPRQGVPLGPYQELVQSLMAAGVNIRELNAVRSALSRVKGGKLLSYLPRTTVINLIISDVIGNPPEIIASGPTISSEGETSVTSTRQAVSILEKYGLYRQHHRWIESALDSPETPVSNLDPDTFIIGSNRIALEAAKRTATQLGYKTMILTTGVEGESRQIGHLLGTVMLETIDSGNPLTPPCCILSGGETTVTVTGNGTGGRNQELALGAAEVLRDIGSGCLLSAGTDGIDGPTDAAGAIVDSTTAFRAAHQGVSIIDALHKNDSYSFFKTLNDLVVTGHTGTNVMDIQIGLIK